MSSFHEKDLKSVLLEMYQVCLARNAAPPLSGLARRLYDLELAPALQAQADSEKAKKEKLHELLAGLDKSDLLVTSSRRQVTPIDPSCVPSQGYFEVEAAKVTEEYANSPCIGTLYPSADADEGRGSISIGCLRLGGSAVTMSL